MGCVQWEAKIDRYIDAEMPSDELAVFSAHLQTCASCAAEALEHFQLKRQIQVAGRCFRPPPGFRLHIERILFQEEKTWLRFWKSPVRLVTAAALLLVIAAGIIYRGEESRRMQTLKQLADIHVAMLASSNPVDVVSSDRHTVKPWFQGKVPFMFNLPDLTGSQFTLVGGRVIYLHQISGAQLVCEIQQHKISVFIFPDRSDARASIATPNVFPKLFLFNSETWSEGGLRYFLISDAETDDLKKLEQFLKDAARP
ncbi:MAG: anti-sigma factor [Acidobacteriales bacterium]|nr:anti-sigma factor [Terriglobales bacterium]